MGSEVCRMPDECAYERHLASNLLNGDRFRRLNVKVRDVHMWPVVPVTEVRNALHLPSNHMAAWTV
jgi:hypothetical protein